MITIKKATIKAYDPVAHTAAVQIAGSLAVWLETVPVATDIPAAEVQAGRECTVIFFTEDNPDDAVIATIQGAVPTSLLTIEVLEDGASVGSVSTVSTIEVYEGGVLVGRTP